MIWLYYVSLAFHKNFFSQYTDSQRFRADSYVMELQMCLHPRYKDLSVGFTELVELCHRQLESSPSANVVERNINTLKNLFNSKIRALMVAAARDVDDENDADEDEVEGDSDDEVAQDNEGRIRQEIEDGINDHFQQFSEEFDRR